MKALSEALWLGLVLQGVGRNFAPLLYDVASPVLDIIQRRRSHRMHDVGRNNLFLQQAIAHHIFQFTKARGADPPAGLDTKALQSS